MFRISVYSMASSLYKIHIGQERRGKGPLISKDESCESSMAIYGHGQTNVVSFLSMCTYTINVHLLYTISHNFESLIL